MLAYQIKPGAIGPLPPTTTTTDSDTFEDFDGWRRSKRVDASTTYVFAVGKDARYAGERMNVSCCHWDARIGGCHLLDADHGLRPQHYAGPSRADRFVLPRCTFTDGARDQLESRLRIVLWVVGATTQCADVAAIAIGLWMAVDVKAPS
ncbi:hypothetical protein C8R46DRAFT_1191596 [Mycena filopes]|nr:hypothetical protein C8R46DRAFT_1191596 [Mycena filopes]